MSFKQLSIQAKLALLILFATVFSLFLAFAGFGLYERTSFRNDIAQQLSTLADTLGSNTAASLAFDDPKTAAEMLSALKANPNIQTAWLYNSSGKVFATYIRAGYISSASPVLQRDGAYFE